MRRSRSRRSSRDSSQDSPVTDNERDILWGDSPPARRICLSTTPGKRLTRSHAAEQDLTDLFECVHPKENKESSTPPLLGLWMRNREDAGSGKKKHKSARLIRRTAGRKLSRIGLDSDLRALTEWTGNLTAAIEESSASKATIDQNPTAGDQNPGGGFPGIAESDGLEDLWEDEAVVNLQEPMIVGQEADKSEKKQNDRRKSAANQSITDDLWGNDDWYDEDSIIRLAIQVENEALSQVSTQTYHTASEDSPMIDVISPTQQVGGDVGTAKPVQRTLQSKGSNSTSSGKGQMVAKFETRSRMTPHYSTNGSSNQTAKLGQTLTTQRTLQHAASTSSYMGSSVAMQKSALTSQRNLLGSTSVRSTGKVPAPKFAQKMQPSKFHSSYRTPASISNAKLSGKGDASNTMGGNPSHRTWQKPPRLTNIAKNLMATNQVQQRPSAPTIKSNRDNTVRVPPIVNATVNTKTSPTQGQAIDDSLDDLFGDGSLPDDMLLALLDNDSDFDEYATAPVDTIPVTASTMGHQTPSRFKGKSQSTGDARKTPLKTNNSRMPVIQTRQVLPNQPMNRTSQHQEASQMTSRHIVGQGVQQANSKTFANMMPPQSLSTSASSSRVTRSSAQLSTPRKTGLAAGSGVHGASSKEGDERRSLSQPVTPSAKKGGEAHRFCSQQEIEKKRQAALAKRKKIKISPTN